MRKKIVKLKKNQRKYKKMRKNWEMFLSCQTGAIYLAKGGFSLVRSSQIRDSSQTLAGVADENGL